MTQHLDIQKEIAEIQRMYAEDPTQKTFNLLLTGEMGMGKTHIVSTARRPIHIDSFDPGGTKISPLRKGIEEGWAYIDTRFEREDPMKPSVGDLWIKEMDRREKLGYFAHLGTYVIDSFSSWQAALMNKQLKGAGISGQPPRFTHDYMPVKTWIYNFIRRIMAFPCDFIITGHLKADRDEASGRIIMRLLAIGDSNVVLPTLFDEVWVAVAKDGASGPSYSILTSPKSFHLARTRIGSMIFSQNEDPDIFKLMQKAKLNPQHKPYGKTEGR